MIETANPEINVDELMARIRAEAALPKSGFPVWSSSVPVAPDSRIVLPRTPSEPAFAIKSTYVLADFLNAHDEAFIRCAYRGILGREPDAHGNQHYLQQLRTGRMTKTDVLGRLRYSPEGRDRAVKIRGLPVSFAVALAGRVPVIGYGLRWLAALLRLPILIYNLARFENDAIGRLEQMNHLFNQGMTGCERALTELNAAKADARILAEALARIEALEQHCKIAPAAPDTPPVGSK